VVYPLINNYKAQRNVRAELSGTVDLGEPVSLYIKEDEIKITGNNLINDNAYKDSAVTGDGGWSKYGDNVITTTDTSVRIASDGSGHENGAYIYFRNGTKSFVDNDLVVGRQYVLSCFMLTDSTTAHLEIRGGSNTADGTTGTGQKELRFTAGSADGHYLRTDDLDTGSAKFVELSNIKLFEVVDHTYKLMAVNDTIPSGGINVEAVGSDLITNGAFADDTGWSHDGTVWDISGSKMVYAGDSTGGSANQSVTITSGKVYEITYDCSSITASSTSEWRITQSGGSTIFGSLPISSGANTVTKTASLDSSGTIRLRGYADSDAFSLDDLTIKEVYGYDYYNAPAYKFGIVSSIYDQSTGAMKTSGVAGDQLEVTVQGECNLRGPGGSATKDKLLSKIGSNGDPTDLNVADAPLPNAVGVITETVSGDTTFPIILFQGVEFSEHFVHKNSLQVMAKCTETITKFRPVSLYLDSNGDLLCRHDDIPEQASEADEDHTGVDPGKWGVAELGGVSGELIPVTVAGKTTISTAASLPEAPAGNLIQRIAESGWIGNNSVSNNFTPNALGVIMETGGGGDEVPITIFSGTPIGTITDWKRTIKVTAKASGAITQYCPVSLYLDQYGNYKCISDDIPNTNTDTANGIWCDFRKWGIAQETVADGENVEIIVQGRTNVVNSLSGANREEYVIKISSSGVVTATNSGGYQLSMLGIVEKEARTSDGTPGTIIIF